MAATFLDRICCKGDGLFEPVDLDIFYAGVRLYVNGTVPASTVAFHLVDLTPAQVSGLDEVLALMPPAPEARPAWCDFLYALFFASRYNFSEVDTTAKVRDVLGLP